MLIVRIKVIFQNQLPDYTLELLLDHKEIMHLFEIILLHFGNDSSFLQVTEIITTSNKK